MQERPTILQMCGQNIPLWCDLFVINEIQEKYGQVGVFERMLLGIEEKEVDGKKVPHKTEPSMEAILFALPLMIKEGYKKATLNGEKMEPVDIEQLMTDINVPFRTLAAILHREFKRCFATKK